MPFPLNRPAKIAIFASGRGSNLESILKVFKKENKLARVALVMSDKENAGALEKAIQNDIISHHCPFPPRKKDKSGEGRRAFEKKAQEKLEQHNIDLICLAGFMRIFSAEFNEVWSGKILNIHPSLLPDFKGLHPQRQALNAGVNETGCTVHFVDAGVDTGAILLQRTVPILKNDTELSLSERILIQEHLAYPKAIELLLLGKVNNRSIQEVSA